MASILISGPAGGGKSAVAREELARRPLAVLADFQAIYVALTGVTRGADRRYPLRVPSLLPIVEYVRRAIITTARGRGIEVVATNSDGDAARRRMLLAELGGGATERVVDPGEQEVVRRLSDRSTGSLDPACRSAINRWYLRV